MILQRRAIVPVFLTMCCIYSTYAMCHVVGYKLLYMSLLKPAAYVLWILLAIIVPTIYLYWSLILLKGPGKIPHQLNSPLNVGPADSGSPKIPLAFLCDPQGFPFFCSHCQHIKPERAFHLSYLNRCVPRFDHNCLWLGTAVGRDSLVPFFKFVQFVSLFTALCLAYVGATIGRAKGDGSMLARLIVVLVINFFGGILLFGLLITTTVQVCSGKTTLDMAAAKDAQIQQRWEERKKKDGWSGRFSRMLFPPPRRFESGLRYVNIQHDNARAVVCYSVSQQPYTFGARQNFMDAFVYRNRVPADAPPASLWTALAIFVVPYVDLFTRVPRSQHVATDYEAWSDAFGPEFLDHVRSRIALGEFTKPAFVSVPGWSSADAQKLSDPPRVLETIK